MQKEEKTLHLEVKEAKEDGTFIGLAAVYGNTDLGGDVIEPGAFTRTLKDRNGEIRLLWQHDQKKPIGKGTLVNTSNGLHIEGKLALGVTAARDAYESIKAGIVDGLSIGYDVIRREMKGGIRHLHEIRLHEVSLVTFPMNELARVSDYKSQDSNKEELLEICAAMRELARRVHWR